MVLEVEVHNTFAIESKSEWLGHLVLSLFLFLVMESLDFSVVDFDVLFWVILEDTIFIISYYFLRKVMSSNYFVERVEQIVVINLQTQNLLTVLIKHLLHDWIVYRKLFWQKTLHYVIMWSSRLHVTSVIHWCTKTLVQLFVRPLKQKEKTYSTSS